MSEALGLVAGDALAQLGQMSAGDVAGLVRDDADHLIGRVGLLQGAGVDEDVAAVEHEGVVAVVPDDAHGHASTAEACGAEDGTRVVLQQVLDLGVADVAEHLCLSGSGACAERDYAHADGGTRDPQKTEVEFVCRVLTSFSSCCPSRQDSDVTLRDPSCEARAGQRT